MFKDIESMSNYHEEKCNSTGLIYSFDKSESEMLCLFASFTYKCYKYEIQNSSPIKDYY